MPFYNLIVLGVASSIYTCMVSYRATVQEQHLAWVLGHSPRGSGSLAIVNSPSHLHAKIDYFSAEHSGRLEMPDDTYTPCKLATWTCYIGYNVKWLALGCVCLSAWWSVNSFDSNLIAWVPLRWVEGIQDEVKECIQEKAVVVEGFPNGSGRFHLWPSAGGGEVGVARNWRALPRSPRAFYGSKHAVSLAAWPYH